MLNCECVGFFCFCFENVGYKRFIVDTDVRSSMIILQSQYSIAMFFFFWIWNQASKFNFLDHDASTVLLLGCFLCMSLKEGDLERFELRTWDMKEGGGVILWNFGGSWQACQH